jgi:hypothetical protein
VCYLDPGLDARAETLEAAVQEPGLRTGSCTNLWNTPISRLLSPLF